MNKNNQNNSEKEQIWQVHSSQFQDLFWKRQNGTENRKYVDNGMCR